jgi:hypothetical protein
MRPSSTRSSASPHVFPRRLYDRFRRYPRSLHDRESASQSQQNHEARIRVGIGHHTTSLGYKMCSNRICRTANSWAQLLINAQTGQVGSRTQFTDYPTNQELSGFSDSVTPGGGIICAPTSLSRQPVRRLRILTSVELDSSMRSMGREPLCPVMYPEPSHCGTHFTPRSDSRW